MAVHQELRTIGENRQMATQSVPARQREKGEIAVPCLVYSRIVGYYRPTQNWAQHKKDEFKDRRTYISPSVATLEAMEPEVVSQGAD